MDSQEEELNSFVFDKRYIQLKYAGKSFKLNDLYYCFHLYSEFLESDVLKHNSDFVKKKMDRENSEGFRCREILAKDVSCRSGLFNSNVLCNV